MARRKPPHPLITLAGWVIIGLAIGYSFYGTGWCLAHITNLFPATRN